MKRRDFFQLAGAGMLTHAAIGADALKHKEITLVLAPTNLGLRPNGDGSEPGTWRAPAALVNAGLRTAVSAAQILQLKCPGYQHEPQENTRIRNGHSIRAFSLELAEKVRSVIAGGGFPVVIGGDCSVLLGGLYGSRLAGGQGLIHVDGHSDFSNPANYDTSKRLGSVAGMDLALASGRGEALLTTWPGVGTPLAADTDIIQIGERETDDPDFYSDLHATRITQLTIQKVLADGIDVTLQRVIDQLATQRLTKVWLHVDLDVLDQKVMPAVDSPGSPGFDYAQLSKVVGTLCASGRIAGAEFTIYDPELDPKRRYAKPLVECIAAGLKVRA
jgi:arginase